MSLADFGITTGRVHYSALRFRYPGGVKWIRDSIGSSIDFDNGVPIVLRRKTKEEPKSLICPEPTLTTYHGSAVGALVKQRLAGYPLGVRREHFIDMDDKGLFPITREGEGISYSLGIYGLVEPWGNMLSIPYRDLNREISRFAGKYDSPGYNPLTDYEKLVLFLVNKVKEIIKAREEKIKREKKNEKDDNRPTASETGLGTNINNSEAARAQRDQKMRDLRRARENAKIEQHLPEIAFGQIWGNADIGYLLLILTSNDIGLIHPDDSVREGGINLITSIVKVILSKFDSEVSSDQVIVGEKYEDTKIKTIEEAISLLQCVSKAITIDHYGVNDRNPVVSRKAKELDDFVIDTGIRFNALRRHFIVLKNQVTAA